MRLMKAFLHNYMCMTLILGFLNTQFSDVICSNVKRIYKSEWNNNNDIDRKLAIDTLANKRVLTNTPENSVIKEKAQLFYRLIRKRSNGVDDTYKQSKQYYAYPVIQSKNKYWRSNMANKWILPFGK